MGPYNSLEQLSSMSESATQGGHLNTSPIQVLWQLTHALAWKCNTSFSHHPLAKTNQATLPTGEDAGKCGKATGCLQNTTVSPTLVTKGIKERTQKKEVSCTQGAWFLPALLSYHHQHRGSWKVFLQFYTTCRIRNPKDWKPLFNFHLGKQELGI